MPADHEAMENIKELVDQFLDDTISDDGMRRLDAVLDASPSARTFFLQYCQMHIELGVDATVEERADKVFDVFCERKDRIESASLAAENLASTSTSHFSVLANVLRGEVSGSRWQSAMVFAVGVLAAVVCYETWYKLHATNQPLGQTAGHSASIQAAPSAEESPIVPVAYLASANGCAWGGSSPQALRVGSGVQLGDEITLHEGIAEFSLKSGVSLSVEGPAALILTSPTSAVLQQGKLTINVPWAVSEFRMLAGTCWLTASREVEFGVDMAPNSVEVHAFAGEVSVARSPFTGSQAMASSSSDDLDDAPALAPVIVHQNRSLVFVSDKNGLEPPQEHEADRGRFATNLSMGGSLPVPRKYVDLILNADPELRPVSYWRFESLDGGIVRNEIEGAPNLKVVGELSLSGDVANRSLDLGRSHSSGHLVSDGLIPLRTGQNYTVEVWAKPSHFHTGVLATLTTDPQPSDKNPDEQCGFRLGMLRGYEVRCGIPGSIRFLHRNPPSRSDGASCNSNCLYKLRRWQHVVAVKQGSTMRLFLDGEKVAEVVEKTPLAPRLRLVAGRALASLPDSSFVGQLDELALYDHALSEAEITKRVKSLDWKPPRKPPTRRNDI